jgi:hypothetical protein
MDVVLCAYCVVQKGERRGEGGRGWPGKVPRSPAAHLRKKEGKRKKQLADRKVPERPGVVKGEGYKKITKRPSKSLFIVAHFNVINCATSIN